MKKTLLFGLVSLMSVSAFANEAAAEATSYGAKGYIAIAMAICLGLAAFGGTLGQGKVGAAAMEGISRNPKAKDDMFIPMIMSLVFIETLVLFAFAISFSLMGKM